MHSTSLDVERKHQLDKNGAGAKLKSVQAASRNSILQRYQHSLETEMQARQLRAATMKQLRSMNCRAFAIHRNPEFMKRGRGKLWWEDDASSEQRAQISHEGNGAALQAWIKTHRAGLQAEAEQMRASSWGTL